ncbi:F12P19.7 isoform 1 [Rhynchospora pubera]|uniref:F12P19.7 isoform 1 n=1 Tax=Rhynchospora pubera TaxID=906938 RepID=A0AAV8EGK1_9POAL|nr:F12P19.7 isoform 1 [Rhynchospora pubera]
MAHSSSCKPCFHMAWYLCLYFVIESRLALHVAGAAKAPPQPAVGNISKVEDARLFQIYYGQSFKVLKNSVDGKSYLLMQDNSKMASRTKYCTGRIKSFVVPLSNYSVDTTNSPLSFFELLGVTESLKGITSDEITSQCVLQLYSSGNLQLVNKTNIQQFSQFNAHFLTNVDEEQACNFAAYAPSDETTPLEKAEWIKYLGTFTNSELKANAVYDAIKSNYVCLSKAAASLRSRFKPVVAWLEYKQGIWSFSKESYKLQYVTDAGGENIDSSITSNIYNVSDPEERDSFHAILCTLDVVIDQTNAPDTTEYTLTTFLENINVVDDSCFGFVTNQSVWRYDKRALGPMTLDWNDGAISQPQLVLADLIEAFFPTGNYTTTYFRNLAKEEGVIKVGPEMCNRDISAPMEPIIVPCQ